MKILSTSIQAALALSSVVPTATPTRGLSDMLGFRYDLDSSVPAISTIDQYYKLGDLYNGTIRIDRVRGANIVIEHRSAKQIASLFGAINDLVNTNYPDWKPSDASVQAAVNSTTQAIAGLDGGTYVYTPQSRTTTSNRVIVAPDKTSFACGMCMSMLDLCDCKSICVVFLCVDVS